MSLLACVIQGMYEPCAASSSIRQALDVFTFSYFVVEILSKTVALGLFGSSGSVLTNHWNTFDIFIIFAEIVDYILIDFGVNIEITHAIKPMRVISRVPALKDLVSVLLDILPMLGNVLILYAFVIHIFAVVGVQLWAGQLLNRCFLGEDIRTKYNVSLSPYFKYISSEKVPFICSPDASSGVRHCIDIPPYRVNGTTCTLTAPNESVDANSCINWNVYYNVCQPGNQNPNVGAINFDNIGYAWITIFQVVTLEGWTDIMHFFMDSYSFWSFVYFILVTIMGSTIIMNVCAVVIATHFSETMERDTVEHHAGSVSVKSLCSTFTSWLRRIFHISRVHLSDSTVERNGPLVQAWIPLQRKLKVIIDSSHFNRFIMAAIFLNVFAMAIEHHGQPEELTAFLQTTNLVFTILFLLEMIVKLLALSWMYFADQDNIFDFAIVIISLWEITSNADSKLSALRAFRVLRFGRLVHFLPYLRRQLLVLRRTVGKSAPLCWLMLFFIFIFSILGMHLFGYKCSFETEFGHVTVDRKNFDSLLWSMLTVFQILTQEDWHLLLYNAMAFTSPWAVTYFVAIIVLGKHVLLNVLVGIVVENYQAMPSENSEQESSAAASVPGSSLPTSLVPRTDPSRTTQDSLCPHNPSRSDVTELSSGEQTAPTDANVDNRSLTLIQKVHRWCKAHEDWSLYVFSPQNRCRVFCQRVNSHSTFDILVLFFILLSCITIAMERPSIKPEHTERQILDVSSYIFTAVFSVEMLVKVIALGFLFGKESYCSSSWNIMDGILVIFSLADVFIEVVTSGKNNVLGILKVFRLLRTLRPLRVIKRTPKLKLAVEALIASVKPMGNIVLICSVFFFFFGIFGVQLFKGTFYHCVGQDLRNITNRNECITARYTWVRKEYNFDNLLQALISLFVMYSKDGWVSIMYNGLDAVGVDQQPVKNYNKWVLLYFISFMIMSFFLLDMFIGVMVETFHQCQQKQRQGDEELEGEELQEQHTEPEEIPYYTHYSPIRRDIHTLCTSKALDLFITFAIIASVLVMAAEHHNQPEYVQRLTEYSQYVFTLILIIEVLLKLVAFGVIRFLKNRWNLMDVIIVLTSIVSIVFGAMKMSQAFPINPNILRVFRVLRLTQVLKANTIRVLLKTVIKTVLQVGNISLLFMFFFFIFAALGVELFGKIECSLDYPCKGLDRHANFSHFGMALLTLYKVCTGDNWSGILKDTLRDCRPDDSECSSYLQWVAPIYLSSFVIMAQFVLINLVVAAIMQALEDSKENKPTNNGLPLEEENLPAT
uniref:Ion transport domain-containing protein n=1 Tax=Amphiprion ocellaris TaxID=80972 RepID=A0AAQ5YGL0_AMPOC